MIFQAVHFIALHIMIFHFVVSPLLRAIEAFDHSFAIKTDDGVSFAAGLAY